MTKAYSPNNYLNMIRVAIATRVPVNRAELMQLHKLHSHLAMLEDMLQQMLSHIAILEDMQQAPCPSTKLGAHHLWATPRPNKQQWPKKGSRHLYLQDKTSLRPRHKQAKRSKARRLSS
jgi:hypothetical protein